MKKISRVLALSAVIVTMFSSNIPAMAHYETGTSSNEGSVKTAEVLTNLCARFDKAGLDGKISESKTTVVDNETKRESKLEDKRNEIDSKRDSARAAADAKRQEHYVKLMESAKTDAQKSAVTAFQSAVEKAVADRRAAFDAARVTYRSGVDAAISSNKTMKEAALTQLKTDVDAAITKAKDSCLGGTPVDQVKATLKDDLKTARQTFKTSIQNLPKVSDTIKVLAANRNTAVEKAKSEFESALDTAKAALETAMAS